MRNIFNSKVLCCGNCSFSQYPLGFHKRWCRDGGRQTSRANDLHCCARSMSVDLFLGRVVLLNTQWHKQDDKPQACVLRSWEFEDVQISLVDQNAAIYEQNRRAQGNYNTLRMIRELEQNSSLLAKCGLRRAINQVHIWLWYNMTFITYFGLFATFHCDMRMMMRMIIVIFVVLMLLFLWHCNLRFE